MRAYLEAARENRKLRRIALVVAVFAAILVVFGVFWALKNTGIAMTGDPVCGYVEHTHTDTCYEQTLTCGQEEQAGHTHSVENGCYAASADGAANNQTLTCTKSETPGHTHTDACYQNTLTCTTPEHTHAQSCYGDAQSQIAQTFSLRAADQTVNTRALPSSVTTHKTIDTFVNKDGVAHPNDNPDTTLDNSSNPSDLHRLYLDAKAGVGAEPIDLLIVVDRSDSMKLGLNGGSTSRMNILKNILGFPKNEYSSVPEGLVDDFLAANNENKVAVIGFSSMSNYPYKDAEVLMSWKSKKEFDYGKALGDPFGATNYCESFRLAEQMLTDSTIRSDGHKKVMLFVSDGVPTIYLNNGQKDGDGSENDSNTKKTIPGTKNYFNAHIKPLVDNPDESGQKLTCYTVGVSEDVTKAPETLQYMADNGGGEYFPANREDELRDALKQLMYGNPCTNIKITDPLSDYVDLAEQPDYKVTLESKLADGSVKQTSLTEGDGKLISVGYDQGTRTVTATFADGFTLNPGETVTLSFNVKTNQAAHEEYENQGKIYPNTGDPNTDYNDNFNTSSGKSGFYSNGTGENEATVTYKVEGTDGSATFPHPVVQVSGDQSNTPPDNPTDDPDPNAEISYHKTIDAFCDGADNPDTTLDNNPNVSSADKADMYRLYLDAAIKGKEQAVDLLIVVDESDSMSKPYSSRRTTRADEVREVLNGTADSRNYDSNKEKGLIYSFLKMNKQNRVAVVGFHGSTGSGGYLEDVEQFNHTGWVSGEGDPGAYGFVNVQPKSLDMRYETSGYTNYTAALMKAEDLFKGQPSSTNKKVMIFLSDGVPTIYFENGVKKGGGNGYADFDKPWENPPYVSVPNRSKKATQDYFVNTFTKNNPSVDVYTVGIIPKQNFGFNLERLDPETLQFMAEKGHGAYHAAGDLTELKKVLREYMKCFNVNNLVIEDTLSTYVDLYTAQPDYKVTMTDANGTPTVLWENGGSQKNMSNGQPIVKNVGANGKRVTATFNPNYQLDPSCTYTLSFNVKTSNAAYEEYKTSGYPVDGTGVGQPSTDYTGNSTSSGQPGFCSNDVAKVTYTPEGGTPQEKEYPHPVVQVALCDFILMKTDDTGDTPLANAKFTLYRQDDSGSVPGLSIGFTGDAGKVKYKEVVLEQPLVTSPTTESGTGGRVEVPGLKPGKYCLVETEAPPGYSMLTEPVSFELKFGTGPHGKITNESGDVIIVNPTDNDALPVLKVKNKAGYKLPETGGPGIEVFLGIGAVLVVCIGLGLAAKRRRNMRV